MTRALAIIAAVLLAYAAPADVVLGNASDLTWALSGSDYIAGWGAAMPTGLVSHWKMNDSAASVAVLDSTGTNSAVAARNTSLVSTNGKINTALSYNGSSDFVLIPSSSDWDFGTNAYSISFWFYAHQRGSIGNGPRIFSSDGAYGHLVSINGTTTNAISYEFGKTGSAWIGAVNTGAGSVNTNTWYHLVIVRAGVAANEMKIYLNGSPGTTGTYATNTADAVTGDIYLGRLGWAGGGWFDGAIDDVRIYRSALSTNDIALIYNAGSGTER